MKQQIIENPIIIHTHLLQKFMRQGKDYANLLALYSFYIYHAQQQKTNQPLATDEFTRKGMNWALDRVKKTKKILKEMKVIEVVQKQKYSYIRLFFIYTQKKIDDILGRNDENSKDIPTPKEKPIEVKAEIKPKEERVKSLFEETLINSQIQPKKVDAIRASILKIKGVEKYIFNHTAFARWVIYCERNAIGYNKNNLKHWLNKLNGRTTIEQIDSVHQAIGKKWKDFYLVPIKESKYHKFLGKSLMTDRDCDTLLDISFKDGKFIYQFKNLKLTTAESPSAIFKRCGYDRTKLKKAPIISTIKDKIMGCIKRV